MLTSLLRHLLPRAAMTYEQAFIRAVTVRAPRARHRAAERLLGWAWLAILVKCLAVVWIIHRWAVPFHPAWIVGPTLAMAALATLVYLWRD